MISIDNKTLVIDDIKLKPSREEEQYALWQIMVNPKVVDKSIETPEEYTVALGLNPKSLDDLRYARKMFMDEFMIWSKQEPIFMEKVKNVQSGVENDKYTWSIFKNGGVVGEISLPIYQQYSYVNNNRDINLLLDPNFKSIGPKVIGEVLDFMFNEVGIERILTEKIADNYDVIDSLLANSFEYYLTQNSNIVRTNQNQERYIVEKHAYYTTKNKYLNFKH